MTQANIYRALINKELDGYILGLERTPGADIRFVSHIYQGTFSDPQEPLCPKGWNRDNGHAYSIWRNNVGRGVCKFCLKKLYKILNPSPTIGGE